MINYTCYTPKRIPSQDLVSHSVIKNYYGFWILVQTNQIRSKKG